MRRQTPSIQACISGMSFSIIYKDINVVKNKTAILENVNIGIRRRRLTAILGLSGAGKTTLLEIMSGHRKNGSILMCNSYFRGTADSSDGQDGIVGEMAGDQQHSITAESREYFLSRYNVDISRDYWPVTGKFMRSISGFVYQNEMIPAWLTVNEYLTYLCKLSGRPLHVIDELINEFDLYKRKNTVIGTFQNGISGGQKKRLAIIAELITEPQILFLDEPTTGLDVLNASKVIKSLKNRHITVVLSIHQPSSNLFFMIDDIIVLHENRVLMQIRTEDVLGWLTRNCFRMGSMLNPADFIFTDVICKYFWENGTFHRIVNGKKRVIDDMVDRYVDHASTPDTNGTANGKQVVFGTMASQPNDADIDMSRPFLANAQTGIGTNSDAVSTRQVVMINEPGTSANDVLTINKVANDVLAINETASNVFAVNEAANDVFTVNETTSDVFAVNKTANDVLAVNKTASDVFTVNKTANEVVVSITPQNKRLPFCRELFILLTRNFKMLSGNKRMIIIRIAQAVIISGSLATIYSDTGNKDVLAWEKNTSGLLYFLVLNILFTCSFNGIAAYYKDEHLVYRETRAMKYGISVYYASKLLADIPFILLYPVVVYTSTYFLTGMSYTLPQFAVMMGVGMVLGYSSHTLGQMFGAAFKDYTLALIALPTTISPIVTISGLMVNPASLNVFCWALQYVSPTRYSFNIMVKNTFVNDIEDPMLEQLVHGFLSIPVSFLSLCMLVLFNVTAGYFLLKYKMYRFSRQ